MKTETNNPWCLACGGSGRKTIKPVFTDTSYQQVCWACNGTGITESFTIYRSDRSDPTVTIHTDIDSKPTTPKRRRKDPRRKQKRKATRKARRRNRT